MELNCADSVLLPTTVGAEAAPDGHYLTFLSLNALAERRSTAANFPLVHASSLHAPSRHTRLEAEVKRSGASLVALQDIDGYERWWAPTMKQLGFDMAVAPRSDDSGVL